MLKPRVLATSIVAGAASLVLVGEASAATYCNASGTVIVVDPYRITSDVTVYHCSTLAPVIIRPIAAAPVYGAAGVRGQSRRVSRRTSRRVSRRR